MLRTTRLAGGFGCKYADPNPRSKLKKRSSSLFITLLTLVECCAQEELQSCKRLLNNLTSKPCGKEMKANYGCLPPLCPGAYSEGVLPGPIPNPEVKPLSADDTAPLGCGNVGRCRTWGFLLYLQLFLLTPNIDSWTRRRTLLARILAHKQSVWASIYTFHSSHKMKTDSAVYFHTFSLSNICLC